MATYTSTQSGPFGDASTWDLNAVPGDGDAFNISRQHIVAVTGDHRPTNGYADSNVYGKLHFEGSGCMLRMNGYLFVQSLSNAYFSEGSSSTGAYFRMDPGSILELRGTNTDAHRLYVRNNTHNQVEIIGTNPNPETTITSDISPSGTPGPIPFTDASEFAVGDWINVYMPERTGLSWIYYRSDEAFWVHDINNNDVYYRQFVGPEATITAVSGNKIVVDEAAVFRKGYHLIFGTGNNRNVKTITDIVYGTNTITFDSNITGSVVGEKAYQTGVDKQHISGDKVLRVAAVTTEDAAVGDNTITVNNTNGFSVGDMILIQPNSDNYNEVTYGNFIADYTITAINTSTKVITFTNGYVSSSQTTLQKVTKAGALVINATRDTQIRAPEGTTFGSDQRSSVYFQYSNSYNRRVKIKNTLLNIGSHSDQNNYAIIGMRGRMSRDLTYAGQYTSEFDGNVIYPVYRSGRNTGYLWERDQLCHRHNVSYNAGSESFYTYGYSASWFSNISICGGSWSINFGNSYDNMEIAYNYSAACTNGQYIPQLGWTGAKAIHHNIVMNSSTCLYSDYIYTSAYLWRCYFDRYWYGPMANANRRSKIYLLDCYLGNKWDVTSPDGNGTWSNVFWQGSVDSNQATTTAFDDSNNVYSICDNFKYNGLREEKRDSIRLWNESEKAWIIYPDHDYNSGTYYCGFCNTFFLPAGAKAFITGIVKLAYSSATNYPYLWAGQCGDLYYQGRYRTYDGVTDDYMYHEQADDKAMVNKYIGFRFLDRFTATCKTDYETRTITVGPFTDDMFIKTGVVGLSVSTGELRRGWYEKDMRIAIDSAYPMTAEVEALSHLSTRVPIRFKKTAEETRTIWGG